MGEIRGVGGMRQVVFHVMLGVIAIGMAVWAGRWGLAGLYDVPADRVLDVWQDSNHPKSPDNQSWEMVLIYLERARGLEPGNAGHLFRLGRLWHYRALDLPLWHPQSRQLFDRSETYYRQAVQLRPSWGYGWINLALVQVQAGQISKETVQALKRGMVLAPTSLPVQRTAIRLGFALWSFLEQSEQQEILAVVARLLPSSGEFVLGHAKLYGRLLTIRPVVEKFPEWRTRLDQLLVEKGKENG